MSRNIPLDRALTDVDRRYLRERGAYGQALEVRIDASFPPAPGAVERFDRELSLEYKRSNGSSPDADALAEALAKNADLEAQLAALQDEKTGPKAPDYSKWNKGDLEAEIDRVNREDPDAGLSKGTKDSMQSALEAYFTE